MRADERVPVLDLLERAFGERELFARYMDFDPAYAPDDFLLAVEDGRPISSVQIFTKTIRLRGSEVRLGGIGSVATDPGHQKRGLASELLRRQHERMRERSLVLGLLFSTWEFYEKLGWERLPARALAVHATEARGDAPAGVTTREFRPGDLDAVRALYDAYSRRFDGTTLRDAAYWEGQLRYAGAPGESFRVATDGAGLVAYARRVDLAAPCAMEFACREDGADALAALLVELAPQRGALVVRLPPGTSLEPPLRERANRVDVTRDPTLMWRVLERAPLEALAGLSQAASDRDVLTTLLADPPAHFWLSDRF